MIERKIGSEKGAVLFKAEGQSQWHANPYFVVERLQDAQLLEAIGNEERSRQADQPKKFDVNDIELAYSSSRSIIKGVLERECEIRGIEFPSLEANEDQN